MSKFLIKFLFRVGASLLLLYILDWLVSGVKIMIFPESSFFGFPSKEKWQVFLILAFSLGIINSFLKPILDFVTFPLRFLTFGLFSLVVNMIVLKLLDIAFNEFLISDLWSLFLSAIIFGLVHGLLGIK